MRGVAAGVLWEKVLHLVLCHAFGLKMYDIRVGSVNANLRLKCRQHSISTVRTYTILAKCSNRNRISQKHDLTDPAEVNFPQ